MLTRPLLSDSDRKLINGDGEVKVSISHPISEEKIRGLVTQLLPDPMLHLILDFCTTDDGVPFARVASNNWKRTLLTYCGNNEKKFEGLITTALLKKDAAYLQKILDAFPESEAQIWTKKRNIKVVTLTVFLWLAGGIPDATLTSLYIQNKDYNAPNTFDDRLPLTIISILIALFWSALVGKLARALTKTYSEHDVLNSQFSDLSENPDIAQDTTNILKRLGQNKRVTDVIQAVREINEVWKQYGIAVKKEQPAQITDLSAEVAAVNEEKPAQITDSSAEVVAVNEEKPSGEDEVQQKARKAYCHFYAAAIKPAAEDNAPRQKRRYCSVM